MAPSVRTHWARTRRLRWLAPAAAAAAVALVAAIPGLSAADSPNLPPLSPRQLLAQVQQAKPVDLSGTINLNTNLGIPDLSALTAAAGGGGRGSQGFHPTSLLSGSHQALVWFAGPDKARVALLQDMAETDVVHNGADTWTWDSTSKKVVHYTRAAQSPTGAGDTTPTEPADPVRTPQQLADELLAQITPSTTVSMAAPIVVADQKAYELVLSPHAAESTVDHVVIAVDSVTSLPLQVQIFAKGQKAAAVDLGFGQMTYATPAASNFKFTPPPGSTVTNKTPNNSDGGSPGASPKTGVTERVAPAGNNKPVTVGQDWTSVVIFPQVQIPAQLNEFLKAATAVNGGKLLSSALVNVLVMNDGRVAAGAVSSSALQAAVAAAP